MDRVRAMDICYIDGAIVIGNLHHLCFPVCVTSDIGFKLRRLQSGDDGKGASTTSSSRLFDPYVIAHSPELLFKELVLLLLYVELLQGQNVNIIILKVSINFIQFSREAKAIPSGDNKFIFDRGRGPVPCNIRTVSFSKEFVSIVVPPVVYRDSRMRRWPRKPPFVFLGVTLGAGVRTCTSSPPFMRLSRSTLFGQPEFGLASGYHFFVSLNILEEHFLAFHCVFIFLFASSNAPEHELKRLDSLVSKSN